MAFSRSQQITFRKMLHKAWRTHCDRECITDSTEASKDAWYRDQLHECAGVVSSTLLNKTRDFEMVMAWFEELADEGEIYWQMRHLQGDARRARHLLDETVKLLHLPEKYVAAIADQMQFGKLIRDYNAEESLKLRIALLTHVRRKAAVSLHPQQQEMLAAPE